VDEKISDSFIIIARDNFSRKHCLYISMFQHINAFLPISWECPAYLKLVCIKYVCTLTSHSRFTYTSQLADRLFSFQKLFLVRFTKVNSVVSNCSLKRLRQSTTIYLFLFAFISVTPFCFSLPNPSFLSTLLFLLHTGFGFVLRSDLRAIIETKINILGN